MPQRKGLVAPQNTFLDTIATRFDGTHSNFVLGNAQVRDHPIVYCSDGLIDLTGFSRSQIMSRCCSCSFLWGQRTTEEAKHMIMDALHNKRELQIKVYFHKHSGEAFLCLLDIVPIKNDKSQVVLFLVSHKDITSERQLKGTASLVSQGSSHGFLQAFGPKPSVVPARFKKPTSFLTAGLATTITAAALGTPSFRKNKLLDYIHTNKSQVSNAHFTSPSNLPNTFQHLGTSNYQNNFRTGNHEQHKRSSATSEQNQSTTLRTQSENHRKYSAPELTECEQTLISKSDEPEKPTNLAAQTVFVSDSEPEEEEECRDSSASDKVSDDDLSTSYKYERRRSRAVLFHLSGRFDQNAKRKHRLKKFRTIPEYKVQDVQASRFILLHYSIFKIIWDWMILVCTFYIAIMVPYNAAFRLGARAKNLLICDIIVELLFIIDILLNFATTYVSKSGQVVYQLRDIAIHYLRGWFFLDLIAAIPFDFIDTVDDRQADSFRGGVGQWIQLLKMARLLRLARLFQKIERYSQYSTIILGLLMCMFFLIAHWFACGWYWIGRLEHESSAHREYSWLVELSRRMHMTSMNISDPEAQQAIYVSSLYFTTTSLTSVGFGNVSPNTVNEKIFSIIAMLIGALMHAAVFGNVTTLIQRMYSRRSAYQTRNQDLKDFTRAHHIPKPLKQRMLEFFQAMWAINRGIDKDAIMQSFPENVRGDIALHLNREMLSLSIFKTASPGCRKCLAQMINTRFATPGEYLVNRGDLLRNIFLVCSGSLEILDPQGTVVGLLGKSDVFGTDIDDFPKLGFSAYDVKSLTYCELQCIALDTAFYHLLEQYPIFRAEFSEALHTDLSFNIREGYEALSSSEVLPAITLNSDEIQQRGQQQQQQRQSIETTESADLLQRAISRTGAERVRQFANWRAESLHGSDNFSKNNNPNSGTKSFDDSENNANIQESPMDVKFPNLNGSTHCRTNRQYPVCVNPYKPHVYETLDFIDETIRPLVVSPDEKFFDDPNGLKQDGFIASRAQFTNNIDQADSTHTKCIAASCPNLYEIGETSGMPLAYIPETLPSINQLTSHNQARKRMSFWSVSRNNQRDRSTNGTCRATCLVHQDMLLFQNFLWHIQRELHSLQKEVRHLSENVLQIRTGSILTHQNKSENGTHFGSPIGQKSASPESGSEPNRLRTDNLRSRNCSTYPDLHRTPHNSPMILPENFTSPKSLNEPRVVKFNLPSRDSMCKHEVGIELTGLGNKPNRSATKRRQATYGSTDSSLTSPQSEFMHDDPNNCFSFPPMEEV